MGKTEHQKLKILYILELLYEQTDEKHAVRMRDIIAYLNQKGISAERKSIYRDLEMLKDFGVDILREQEYRGGYYIGSRDFFCVMNFDDCTASTKSFNSASSKSRLPI